MEWMYFSASGDSEIDCLILWMKCCNGSLICYADDKQVMLGFLRVQMQAERCFGAIEWTLATLCTVLQ